MPLSDNEIVLEQIVEIRFQALGRIMDIRGLIADKISVQMNLAYWAITDNRVDFKISENTDREKAYVSHHNLGYIVKNSDTRTYFQERAMKFIRELYRIDGFELREIRRFGVRIKFLFPHQGEFEDLLNKITELMPVNQNYVLPFDAQIEDLGPIIILKKGDTKIKFHSGPMAKEQAATYLQGQENLPDVGFFGDLDQSKTDIGRISEQEVSRILKSLNDQAWKTIDFYNNLII